MFLLETRTRAANLQSLPLRRNNEQLKLLVVLQFSRTFSQQTTHEMETPGTQSSKEPVNIIEHVYKALESSHPILGSHVSLNSGICSSKTFYFK
jgi:hypothetical protein